MKNLVRSEHAVIGSSAGAVQAMARRQFAVSLFVVIAIATFVALAALSPMQRDPADSAPRLSAGVQAPTFVVPLAQPVVVGRAE